VPVKDQRYALVVIDSRGRSVQRVVISRRTLRLGITALAVIIAATGSMFFHGLWLYPSASESSHIRAENAAVANLVQELQHSLDDAAQWNADTQFALTQVWRKSSLGVDSRSLAIGPLEGSGQEETATATDGSDRVLTVDPVALPLEMHRLASDRERMQSRLDELLEYFNDEKKVLSNTPSIKPAQTSYLTSTFGKRQDPMTANTIAMHKGVDLGGVYGSEIVAPADGVVIFTGYRGGYGLTVVLDHGYGLQTHFGHLSASRVHVGQRVQRGERIASMGSSGRSTGTHVHYEVRRNGRPINPMRFILDW
jgi:murein DD-endopeptidase MepM/ murein hydrolase activator NlpD